jgi:hypothetical protein
LSFNRFKTEKTKYDEYLIDRSNGLDRFTGTTVIDSTLGIITVHGVAAALSGTARPKLGCKKIKRDEYVISNNVNFIQWKTVKEQDGIFRNMDVDPQNVKIVGGRSQRLPEEWNNTRLGHNFSLVWVCKHIGGAIDMGHSQGTVGSG